MRDQTTMKTPSPRHAALPVALAVLALLSLPACSRDEAAAPAAPDAAKAEADPKAKAPAAAGEEGESEEVRLDAALLKSLGVEIQPVQASTLSEQLRAPGEVVDNAYGTTLITPRVVSLVVRRHAKLGDEVRAGAPLVTLSSVEVASAQADLRTAEQESRRVAALGREAVSGRRITEAQIAADKARAVARAYGLPGTAPGGANGEFTLTAPHAGRITEDNFVVGERIEPGKALFRLVDESQVWVDAKVPPASVARIQPGSEAAVWFAGRDYPGKVMRAAHRTSDATRNASVRVQVDNRDDAMHGGDFVEVRFDAGTLAAQSGGAATEVAVPTDAVVQLSGDTVVFRRDADGGIEAVPVRVGEAVGDLTVIREGLKAGDQVAVKGAFAIKSQLLKAQMGEGDAH